MAPRGSKKVWANRNKMELEDPSERLSLGKPPVVEVMLGFDFKKPNKISALHLGRFWTEIAEQYPTLERIDKAVVQVAFGFAEEPQKLISQDRAWVLQTKRGAISLSWVKQPHLDYPRFTEIKDRFNQLFALFSESLEQQGIETDIEGIHLCYVNKIDFPENTTSPWVTQVFTNLTWPEPEGALVPDAFSLQATYPFPSGRGRVAVSINSPVIDVTRDSGRPVILFQLDARGRVSPNTSNEELSGWFVEARDSVSTVFEQLTEESIREKEWEQAKK